MRTAAECAWGRDDCLTCTFPPAALCCSMRRTPMHDRCRRARCHAHAGKRAVWLHYACIIHSSRVTGLLLSSTGRMHSHCTHAPACTRAGLPLPVCVRRWRHGQQHATHMPRACPHACISVAAHPQARPTWGMPPTHPAPPEPALPCPGPSRPNPGTPTRPACRCPTAASSTG